MKALRQTVDLSAYPDLVVTYLGMTVNMLTWVLALAALKEFAGQNRFVPKEFYPR